VKRKHPAEALDREGKMVCPAIAIGELPRMAGSQDESAQQEEEVDAEIAAIDNEKRLVGKVGPGAQMEEDNPEREKAAQRSEGFDLTHCCLL